VLQRLLALIAKEFIQIRRDPRTLAMMIVLPLLWLVMFGYAFSFDIKTVKVAIINQNQSPIGSKIATALTGYDRFEQVTLPDQSEEAIRTAIHRDQIHMGVLIPADLTKDGHLQVILDGTNIFAAQTASRLLQLALEPLQAQIGQTSGGAASPGLLPTVSILYNPDLQSAPIMIPGLLGLVTMFMSTLMTALGVVREREYGTMEQLIVTPIKPFELMLGKLIPYALVAAFDFGLVFVAGSYLFHLTFMGNLPLFLALTLLFLTTTLGVGLLISTVAQNQAQAMQLAMLTIFPQILVSGLIFPLASMPKAIQYVAQVLPFTHFVPIARGMFIKGQELSLLTKPVLVLTAYAIVVVTLASLRFRKRLG
jgi:ABC-2 type transport system permease protein